MFLKACPKIRRMSLLGQAANLKCSLPFTLIPSREAKKLPSDIVSAHGHKCNAA